MPNILISLLSTHVVQAVIIGAVLAFLTANIIMNAKIKTIQLTFNGWSTTLKCGQPGSGILLRAATSKFLPAVNSAEEAVYWITTIDGDRKRLSSRHNYLLHFPAGQTPPNGAFWSLTITDIVGYMVSNPIDRHSVGDRYGLVSNPDGSIDIYLQQKAPAAHESNWLPTPRGSFQLTLRVYLPGQAILDGTYRVPPVVKVH